MQTPTLTPADLNKIRRITRGRWMPKTIEAQAMFLAAATGGISPTPSR